MSCVDEIFIGDEGTSIEFLVKECDDSDPDNPIEVLVDISSATSLEIIFLLPDELGTTLLKTEPDVKFITDGTDSLFHYLSIPSDFSIEGTWKAQGRITMPSGKWYTSKISFKVKDVIS